MAGEVAPYIEIELSRLITKGPHPVLKFLNAVNDIGKSKNN